MDLDETLDRLLRIEAAHHATLTVVTALLKSHPDPERFRDEWHKRRALVEEARLHVANGLDADAQTQAGLSHMKDAFRRMQELIDLAVPPA